MTKLAAAAFFAVLVLCAPAGAMIGHVGALAAPQRATVEAQIVADMTPIVCTPSAERLVPIYGL